MTKNQILAVIIAGLLVSGGAYYAGTQRQNQQGNDEVDDNLVIKKEIEGNKDDLVYFSVKPGDTVSGVLNFTGTVKNAYFFEGNIGINILDENKNVLKRGHATSTTEWMTTGPVSFKGSIDLAGLPLGPAYIQIANDNASGLPEHDKFIYIPIVIGQ